MDLRRILTLLVILTASSGQENDVIDPTKVITQLNLSLREEKIPSIINYLLNNSVETHQISTDDIIKLSKLDQYNQNDLIQVFRYFNISEVYTVDNLETLFTSLNIIFGDFYREVTARLQLSRTQVSDVIDALEIPPEFWQVVSLGEVEEVYDVLRQGVYNEENVEKAVAVTGKSTTEIYTTARNLLKEKVLPIESPQFMEILKRKGWSRINALHLYNALNITTRDVYNVEKFQQIFTNISESLNNDTILAIFTGPKNLSLHQISYDNLVNKVDGVLVKITANEREVALKKISSLGPSIVELATLSPGSEYIEIVENYNISDNCIYVSIHDGQATVLDVDVDDLTVVKNDQMRFILGGALICEGRLYGLAREQNENAIIFDGFYTEETPAPPEEDDYSGNFNRGFSLSSSFFILAFNVLIVFILL